MMAYRLFVSLVLMAVLLSGCTTYSEKTAPLDNTIDTISQPQTDTFQPMAETINGFAYTPEGDSVPVKLTIRVENVLEGDEAYQKMISQGAQLPIPAAGKEYILLALKVTYEDGALDTFNFYENYPASLAAARIHFDIPNEKSNSVDVTHDLPNSIWGPDPFTGYSLKKGESISGEIAFVQDIGNTQPLYFEGYSQVITFQIHSIESSDITGNTWQEAYRKVIQSDRNNLLADPEHFRSQVEETQVYIGIHDFDEDGTPELIFGDGVSLAVFTYSDGSAAKIQDICFPETLWCVNGVCFQGNALRAECNGSGGSAYVNFGYLDGQYLMGRYTEQCPDIPCTVNETVCTLEEFTRIYPLNETDYSDYQSGVLKEKANLIHNGSEWVIQLNSGEEIKVDSTFDFSQFAW